MTLDPILMDMLALRAAYAVAVVALAVVLLRQGLPFGALALVVAAVLVRRSAESGRLHRLAIRAVRAVRPS
jgi:hypothetical protein